MNQKVKKKWVEALRGRKYKQCNGQLREIDDKGNKTYCCLGVLCDLYNKKLWGKEFENNDSVLPGRVMKWAGLEDDDPILSPKIAERDNDEYDGIASSLNDNGYKFNEIADFIERNL